MAVIAAGASDWPKASDITGPKTCTASFSFSSEVGAAPTRKCFRELKSRWRISGSARSM
ncbi:hypothetical protein D3C84_1161510 [compost metagenome]